MILGTGIWLTVKGRFLQIRKLPAILPEALRGREKQGGVSAFQALSASLAGSLGTGNIVGVAAALTAGGPGAVVWMWVSAFFGMMTVYAESVLAVKFASRKRPGAIGYINKALGTPWAVIYAAGCVLAALGMGTMAQTGAVAAALSGVGVSKTGAGVLCAVLLIVCVRGGMQKAVKVTEKLVPFMAGVFLSACIIVLVLRADRIAGAFCDMLGQAFSFKAAAGGTAGMWLAAKAGVSRGVFSNEAGLGSGTFALCRTAEKSPEEVGALGALQVFIDTILLCTVTALCLLVSPGTGEGAEQTLSSFSAVLGSWGSRAVSLSMALFAFASVIAWSCYGMDALAFLVPAAGKPERGVYLAAAAAACIVGCVMPVSGILFCCDAFNGIMAVPNILALVCLSGEIFEKNGGKTQSFCAIFAQNAK